MPGPTLPRCCTGRELDSALDIGPENPVFQVEILVLESHFTTNNAGDCGNYGQSQPFDWVV